MKSIKSILLVVLALSLVLSLAACSSIPANTVFSSDDLGGKIIGVQLGTTGDVYASDYEADGSTIERYNKGADAIQALKQGKVDCVVIDNEPAKAFVAKNNDLIVLDEPLTVEDYAIAIAKDNTDLKDKVNAALATLTENGVLDQIKNNYIGDDTKGTCPYVSPADVKRTNGTLIMATNAAFEPYEFYDGDKVVGIDAEMAQAVADILGMELQIEDMEFDSILAAIQSGKADIGVAGMTVKPDRLESVNFSDPYTTATQVIVVRAK